jgi:hypothetical protein
MLTIAGTAFWTVVAVVVAIVKVTIGPETSLGEVYLTAAPIAAVAPTIAIVFGALGVIAAGRVQTQQWIPLRQRMLHDVATIPSTYLAQVASRPNPATGGQIIAVDLVTGYQGPLWLSGCDLPLAAVVCFTDTPTGPQVRAWMTGRLWDACEREAHRIDRRTNTDDDQEEAPEQDIRAIAEDTIAEANRMLRDNDRQ